MISLPFIFLVGTSLWLAFPPHALPASIFISMAVFMLGLDNTTKSFRYGYVFYLGAVTAFIGYWFSYYFRLQLGTGYVLSYALTSVICLYTSLYIGAICLIYTKIKTRIQLFNLCILFPSLWVLTELIRGFFFPRSWYALGNTQVDNPVFRGYYALFGTYFVSWLIVALAGIIAYTMLNFKLRTLLKSILALFIFIVCSYGLSLIQYTKPYGKPITVALLQPSIFSSTNFTAEKQLEIEKVSAKLVDSTTADLIVLPETVFGTDYHYLTFNYFNILKAMANGKNAQLIFGSPINFGDAPHQTGLLEINHPNKPIYLKHYLVPFGEYDPFKNTFMEQVLYQIGFRLSEYIPGSYYQPPLELLGQKFAFNVCYENTINDYVAANARYATILLNQSDLSWYGETQMKDVSVQFSQGRALENQRYFLQDGNTGDTVIINPQGKIEQKIPSFVSGALIGKVQGYSGTTPFEIVGNIPIWLLCCISVLVALVYKRSKYPIYNLIR